MTNQKLYVAGHRGMVGSAIVRQLLAQGVAQTSMVTRTHAELDLTNQLAVQQFFAKEKPTQVYLAAATVGGIHANNTYPADFIYENLMVQANVIEAAFQNGVQKLLFLGSGEAARAAQGQRLQRQRERGINTSARRVIESTALTNQTAI